MPVAFATVAEGKCDHPVLENIIIGLCKKHGIEVGNINPTQPEIDKTGRQLGFGGWGQVFRWLREKRYDEAFQYNDFVIIHLDTDACEEVDFDIQKYSDGVEKNPLELVNAVIEKLKGLIGNEDLAIYQGRFHFAISVHNIECWLLPLWGKKTEYCLIHSCKLRVDKGLSREKQPGLNKEDIRTYDNASSKLRKHSSLFDTAKSQDSLQHFLDSISNACQEVKPQPSDDKS